MLSRRTFLKLAPAMVAPSFKRPPLRAWAHGASPAYLPLVAPPEAAPIPPKPATEITRAINNAVLDRLPFDNKDDFAGAARGLIAKLPNDGLILNPDPDISIPVWNLPAYTFLQEGAPPEANPNLWRQAQLNLFNGLFEVIPGIYQVRGVDLSNMTIIEGKKGIIVIDPLVSCETARVALDL
jgi:alkyl sulfatase BDS1-like metallo-beta-lactamase superfamily hydrolase